MPCRAHPELITHGPRHARNARHGPVPVVPLGRVLRVVRVVRDHGHLVDVEQARAPLRDAVLEAPVARRVHAANPLALLLPARLGVRERHDPLQVGVLLAALVLARSAAEARVAVHALPGGDPRREQQRGGPQPRQSARGHGAFLHWHCQKSTRDGRRRFGMRPNTEWARREGRRGREGGGGPGWLSG